MIDGITRKEEYYLLTFDIEGYTLLPLTFELNSLFEKPVCALTYKKETVSGLDGATLDIRWYRENSIQNYEQINATDSDFLEELLNSNAHKEHKDAN